MKSLKILIFSVLTTVVITAGRSFCQSLSAEDDPPVPTVLPVISSAGSQPWSVRTGLYIFTGNTASEFYQLAPAILAGYDAWKRSRLSLNLSTGLSFNSIKYNDHRHNLYMVPLNLALVCDIPNPGARAWPAAGIGMCLSGKADQNKTFKRTHYSLSYGFNFMGGIRISLSEKVIFTIDLTYNLLIPPTSDEINMSGVTVFAGVKW